MSGIEFLPLVAIALLFWLLVIRPQSRRARELRNLQSSLDVGDEVMLTSGILGTIRALDDEHVSVEIAAGVTIRVVRGAVGIKQPTQLAQDHDDPVDPGPSHDQEAGPEGPAPEEKN